MSEGTLKTYVIRLEAETVDEEVEAQSEEQGVATFTFKVNGEAVATLSTEVDCSVEPEEVSPLKSGGGDASDDADASDDTDSGGDSDGPTAIAGT